MPLRILVVEDYAPFRRLACEALERRDEFEIFEATDGFEALQRAEVLQPDLILLDINLPKLHGFEVAARIGALAPHAKLLFMSQESSPDIVRRGLSLGAHGYIHKQSAGTDLWAAIDAVLAGRRFVSGSIALTEPTEAPAVHRRHEILFCPDDAAIVTGFARFIAAALNAGDAGLILATKTHQTDLLRELRTRGVDIDGARERGTCLLFDADVAPDLDRFAEVINGVRAAAVKAGKAHARVAFCGERAGRLWAAGRTAECVELERLCGELADHVDMLCAYPVPYETDDQALAAICAGHTAVFAA